MASIREDLSGKVPAYRVRVRVSGHPTASATFTTRSEAETYVKVTEAALRAKPRVTTVREIEPKAVSPTLSAIIARYMREVLPTKRQATIKAQGQQLNWWAKELGKLAFDTVTPMQVAEAKGKLIKRGNMPSTVNRYLSALSHVYTTAIKDWFIPGVDNPVSKVRRLHEDNEKVRYLTDEERPRLLAACKESGNAMLYTIVMAALSTGMRRNEILKLTWGDYDASRSALHVRDSKNHEPRTLPLTGEAGALLKVLHDTRCNETPETLIFKGPKGAKVYAIENAWQGALRKAGITGFCFHSLRHTCGSYLAMMGCTQLDIAKVLGHKKIATTQRYTHLSTSHIRGILDNLTSTL